MHIGLVHVRQPLSRPRRHAPQEKIKSIALEAQHVKEAVTMPKDAGLQYRSEKATIAARGFVSDGLSNLESLE